MPSTQLLILVNFASATAFHTRMTQTHLKCAGRAMVGALQGAVGRLDAPL